MCGIAGCVLAPGHRPDPALLQKMADALAPRGPDGHGIVVWENAGLVNTRLAIVDPGATGAQPVSDPSGAWTLTYNGEIYNHQELRTELPVDGWRGHSDSETLVHALAQWGTAAIPRCNGAFAYAALDRTRRRLLLVRDRFGKKPLYVARDARGLWFASEMRALLAAGIASEPDLGVLVHGATRGWVNGPRTPLATVSRLEPGTVRSIDLDSLAEHDERWFTVSDLVDPEFAGELAALPRAELVERVDEQLRGAVTRRLMSDVPLGTMLSGGLDSSLITAIAHERQPAFTAFGLSLPFAASIDEGEHAQRAADDIGADFELVSVGADEFRHSIVEAVRLFEYPLHSPAVIPITLLAARARERGVKVLLTGEGADELFGGYDALQIPERRAFMPLPVTVGRGALSVVRHGRRGAVNFLRRAGVVPEPKPPFEADAAVVAARDERRRLAREAYAHHSGPRAVLESELLASLEVSAFGYLLNRMDKNAMGCSVETRVPFLDPGVARLAVNLPLEARTQPRPKGVLRDVGRRHLARRVAYRYKVPGMMFDSRTVIDGSASQAFLADGMLRDLLEVSPSAWADAVASATRVRPLSIWSAEIWCRLFLRRDTSEQVSAALWAV